MEEGFKAFYRDILQKELEGTLPEAIQARYAVESCLTHGETSETYLVTRREDGLKAVLRVSKLLGGEDAQVEYDTLRRLAHPAMPKALDVLIEGGRGYLVRSYMEGQTLRHYVEQYGPLGEAEMIDIAASLCEMLDYLHGQTPPIIHRDIKPDNIIIDPEGHIRLIDFGIARTYREQATSDTIAVGTRSYMAPEQFGGSQTDARADIYALGVVMIYMGTLSPDRTNLRHRFPHKALLPVVQRCIEYDPQRRYRDGTSVRRALLFIKRGGRRRVAKIAVAGIVALALAGGNFYLGRRLGYDQGYGRGHWLGVEEGTQSGFQQGFDEGHAQGHALGYDEGMSQFELMRSMQVDTSATEYFDQAGGAARGNTGANLLNKGLCASDDTFIYLAYENSILRMTAGGESVVTLCEMQGDNLNVCGGFLYFVSRDGVWRVRPDGSDLEQVTTIRFDRMFIVENMIYGTNTTDSLHLYRMNPDGTGLEKVFDRSYMYYMNIENGQVVYSDGEDRNRLYRRPLDGGEPVLLDDADVHWVNVIGEYVFYTVYGKDSNLMRIRMDGTGREAICRASPAYTNITPYGFFYAEGYESNKLYWSSFDGKTQMLMDVRASNINVAGQWVFFINRDDGDAMYRMRVNGTDIERVSDLY